MYGRAIWPDMTFSKKNGIASIPQKEESTASIMNLAGSMAPAKREFGTLLHSQKKKEEVALGPFEV